MAWDSSKTTGDLITSSDFNTRTTIMKEGVQTANLDARTITAGNHATLATLTLPAGNSIKIHASALDPSGTTGLNIVVRNVTGATDIYSNNSGYNSGGDLASGGSGDQIELRVENNSGSEQNNVNAMIKYEISSV